MRKPLSFLLLSVITFYEPSFGIADLFPIVGLQEFFYDQVSRSRYSILSDAGLGMAMFSLGLFMALQPKMIACGNKLAAFSMVIRFITGPVVMAVASIIISLRGDLLRIAIVQAALPQGIVPFVFSIEYNNHPAVLSTAMLTALPIDLLYYILLGL
ncbi:hypothetical protein Droror1_Dr00023394 [Drosera rotundifolia]